MKSLHLPRAFALVTPVFRQNIASPEVQSDGRVTFRLKAPQAREVQVECESLKKIPMEKDDQGVWSATTPPLDPDYYGYSFTVDGLRCMDLGNPLMKYNLLGSESEVHVPGPPSLPWEINDVPRGVLHRHTYKSKAANDERAYFVYTPPGYNPRSSKRYPVLYLLHGYSDDASAWWSVGQANVIFDNLITRGRMKPMVVAMPLGYGTMDILKRGWSRARNTELWKRNARQFQTTFLDEVLPQVEKNYRALTDRKSRAIAGLSMGGAESITVGLNNLNRFAWIGAFSSGGLDTNFSRAFPKLDAQANEKIRLLWISCGKDDGLLKPNLQFVQWLDSEGIHHTWTEVPGAHSWRVWRRNLAAFAPLLFK
jgi:enterochelin esterase family protein